MNSLESRVSRLELRANRWRNASVLLAVGLVAVVAMGENRIEPRTLEVDRIAFKDATGHIRMELLSTAPEGKASSYFGMKFYNDEGEEAGRLGMSSNSLMLMMHGSEKDSRKVMNQTLLSMKDATDDTRDILTRLAKSQGQEVIMVQSGGVTLGGSNNTGTSVSAGRVAVYGGAVEVRDNINGGASACLGKAETVEEKTGNKTSHPASTLTLFSADGKVLFQAPR